MPRNNSKFSWSILIFVQLSIALATPPKIAYPDSYEMYSYKEPRSMNDLRHQHVRQAMIDVTDTINEVQKILQQDPRLPRLTRGEIEDLFEMVTREEYKRSLAAGDLERAKHMRSLMLVLPFNTNNYSEERLEELFTQTPVTKMVNQVSKNPKPQRIVLPASAENSVLDMIGAHSDVANQRMPTTFKPNYATNAKTTYTAPVTTFHPKGTVPALPSYQPKATAQTVTNYQPKATLQTTGSMYPNLQTIASFRPKAAYNPASTFLPKTTAQTTLNYPPKSTVQTISTFHPKNVHTNSANAIPNVISTYHPKTATFKVTPETFIPSQAPSRFSSRFSAQTTHFTPTVTPSMRPNVKNLLATIGLEPDEAPSQPEYIVEYEASTISGPTTERTTTTTTEVPTTTTTTTTTTTPKPELTPELKELLESFGLLTNEQPPAHATSGPYQDEFLPIFPSSLIDETLSVSEFRPLPKSVTAADIEEKYDTSKSVTASGVEQKDGSFEFKADDFSAFKPLPLPEEKAATDEELDSLLKSYGILEEEERDSKAFESEIEKLNEDSIESESEIFEVTQKPSISRMSTVPEVDVGFLSPDLARVLGNIGVKNVNKPATSTTPFITRRVDTTASDQDTIGQVSSSTMQNDYQKLNLLLDTIKQLDNLNANLSDDELDRLNLKHFNLSKETLTESEGPTVDYARSHQAKNEVKRQTNSSEPTRIQLDITGTSAGNSSDDSDDDEKLDDGLKLDDLNLDDDDVGTSPIPKREGKKDDLEKDTDADEGTSSTSTTTTTEEPRNGSISDLAGSFGGNDGLDTVSEEPLPKPKKNGFYFFSDWNSFLEVGEDPDKVVVRFDPKIGDSSQFVKIKTP